MKIGLERIDIQERVTVEVLLDSSIMELVTVPSTRRNILSIW